MKILDKDIALPFQNIIHTIVEFGVLTEAKICLHILISYIFIHIMNTVFEYMLLFPVHRILSKRYHIYFKKTIQNNDKNDE